ncbi:hypothetical protein GGI15_002430 [Coemansia interrupta]|uniref:Uncharacterized protein n=1 Tax=Coemansia interrupta TaxID=1126814 RepID=A0A9W8HLJ0_9FUNG|nr:hypothetical protein GGI15_002430 [Coemansia interrupta]
MAARQQADLESLYGSSIFGDTNGTGAGGHLVDGSDLSEYAQLCRRLFPTLLSADNDDNEQDEFVDMAEPETEETMARYFKYLTGLPLPSLKMEPTLLNGDLQRVSNELTTLLFNECFRPSVRTSGSDKSSDEEYLSQSGVEKPEEQARSIFGVINDMNKTAVSVSAELEAELGKTQGILKRLETACGMFATEMTELDQRAKLVHQVLDKQDLVARVVELPRVMQMCVAGGYYEEAVEIAEHVRLSGDRLVRDISEDVQMLPGSKDSTFLAPGSKEQLVGFVTTIQKQVQSEYEAMILNLCRELSYVRSGILSSTQQHNSAQGQRAMSGLNLKMDGAADTGLRLFGDNSHEMSAKRMSQMAKVVSILRSVGVFSEDELRMLYLRSRWQAWVNTADSLGGFAPAVDIAAASQSPTDTPKTLFSISPSVFQSPDTQSESGGAKRSSSKRGTASSAEIATYLTKYIDSFFLWLAEVNMQYQALFSAKAANISSDSDGLDTTFHGDPFTDLALYSSQQLTSTAVPMLSLLTDASSISSLESLVASHSQILSPSNIDFATPFLIQTLRERGFASVVSGIEDAVMSACQKIQSIESLPFRRPARHATNSPEGHEGWDQLAAPTRPSLDLADRFSADMADYPQRFLGQHRVSPIGLLQYPLLSQLLHAFRDGLHSLRILVLAGENDDSDDASVLLGMVSIVLESELIDVGESIASLCKAVETSSETHGEDSAKQTARDVCVAFVFGLARQVAEIFEEVASLSEPASVVESGLAAGDLSRMMTTGSANSIKSMCVVGAGQMGIGIGLVAARVAKLKVQFVDSSPAQLEKGLEFMDKLLVKDVAKGRCTEDERSEVKSRISSVSSISKMSKADFVVEAVSENDVPGFIANRLLMPYINEAIVVLQEGIATKEDIDATMRLGTNNPMGPLTLADFIGLDTCLAIMKVLHGELGDSKYRPAVLLQKYVDAGWLGLKSGRGFYDYTP